MTWQNRLCFHRVVAAHFSPLHVRVLLSKAGKASKVTVWSLFSFLSCQGTKIHQGSQTHSHVLTVGQRGDTTQTGISAPLIFLILNNFSQILNTEFLSSYSLMAFMIVFGGCTVHQGAAVSHYLFSSHTQIHLSRTPHRGDPKQVMTDQSELHCSALCPCFHTYSLASWC